MESTVTIAVGASLSGAIDIVGVEGNSTIVGIWVPAEFDGNQIAFQAARGSIGGTYVPVYAADGTEVVVTAAASRLILLDPADFIAVQFVKLQARTTGVAQNQATTDTILYLVRRRVA